MNHNVYYVGCCIDFVNIALLHFELNELNVNFIRGLQKKDLNSLKKQKIKKCHCISTWLEPIFSILSLSMPLNWNRRINILVSHTHNQLDPE